MSIFGVSQHTREPIVQANHVQRRHANAINSKIRKIAFCAFAIYALASLPVALAAKKKDCVQSCIEDYGEGFTETFLCFLSCLIFG